MQIAPQRFNECLMQFVRTVLIPGARSAAVKFGLGFIAGSGRLDVAAFRPFLETAGVAGPDGSIDVDRLKTATFSGLDAAGGLRFDALGITLDRSDVEKFFRLVETGSAQ